MVERLIKEDICLEVCPTSNKILVTELEHSIKNHPLRRIYEKGIKLCLNPDDAGMFGNISHIEYKIAKETFGFKRTELLDITLNAAESAFINGKIKQNLINNVYKTFNKDDLSELDKIISNATNNHLKQRLIRRLEEAKNIISK